MSVPTFMGVDPDSQHPAYALVSVRGVLRVRGGGTRKDAKLLTSARGILDELEWQAPSRCAVERQTARGLWSESCELVALNHGTWRACCELSRVPYVGVLPTQWQGWAEQLPLFSGPVSGSGKHYHRVARALGLAANEDQAAALWIAVYLAHLSGVAVPLFVIEPPQTNTGQA